MNREIVKTQKVIWDKEAHKKRCYILLVINKIIVRATVRFQLQHVQMDEMKD